MNERSRLQFRLGHCLLLMTLLAVWLADYKLRSETARMRDALKSYSAIASFLVVEDRNKLQVLEEPQIWNHEQVWQVYVPQPTPLELLCVQRRGQAQGSAADDFRTPLAPGRHRIVFRHEIPQKRRTGVPAFAGVYLIVDEQEHELSLRQLDENEMPAPMQLSQNLRGSTKSQAATEPLELLSAGPTDGVTWKIWIQPADAQHAGY